MFFFLSGTGTISLKREGEDSRIVTRLGEGSKVYSTMLLAKRLDCFYGRWQLCLQFENSSGKFGYGTEYKKKDKFRLTTGGIFGFIIIRVRYGMSMPRPDLSSLSN